MNWFTVYLFLCLQADKAGWRVHGHKLLANYHLKGQTDKASCKVAGLQQKMFIGMGKLYVYCGLQCYWSGCDFGLGVKLQPVIPAIY